MLKLFTEDETSGQYTNKGRGGKGHIAFMERDFGSSVRLGREDTSDVCTQASGTQNKCVSK